MAEKGGDITADATSCAAYLKGLRDGAEAAQRILAERPFCASGATLDQMARAIVKHVELRPENARRQAANEALSALGEAYPCKARQ